MKLKTILAVLFVGGLLASMAVAKPPPGKGNPHATTGTTASSTGTTTTGHGKSGGKVTLCHKTGSKTNPWVKVTVSAKAAAQREKKGDVPVGADGKCPAAKTKPHSTSTGTTSTGTTTTTG
jgi:hypothetical protein